MRRSGAPHHHSCVNFFRYTWCPSLRSSSSTRPTCDTLLSEVVLIIGSAIVPSSPAKSWNFVILRTEIVEFLTFDVRIADFVTFGAQILEFVIVSSCEVVQGRLLVVEN